MKMLGQCEGVSWMGMDFEIQLHQMEKRACGGKYTIW